MPALVQLEHLQGDPFTAVPVTMVRFRNDDTSGVDSVSPITSPEDVRGALAAPLAGLITAQDFDIIPETPGHFEEFEYAIIDAGNPRQEVVELIAAAPSATNPGYDTLQAIVRLPHTQGAQVQKCVASFSKTFRLNLTSAPQHAISNIRFVRIAPMPYGVFDQFQVSAAYTPASNYPWTSTADKVYLKVPTSQSVVIRGNPVSVLGPLDGTLVEIQWLYVARTLSAAGQIAASTGSGGSEGCGSSSGSSFQTPGTSGSSQLTTQLQINPTLYRWRWDES